MAINPKQFLNDVEEFHALAIGFFEVLCPWPPHFKGMPTTESCDLKKEYHYYMFGRALGILAWILIANIAKVLFF